MNNILNNWGEIKNLIESLEEDMGKTAGGNKAAGVRVRKGMKVDVKVIITIATLLIPLVGFYYTTNMRLDALEAAVVSVQNDIKQVKKLNKKKRKKK
jgi:hypothetical protein